MKFSEAFIILTRTEWDIIKSGHSFSCTVPVVLTRYKWNLCFLDRFEKKKIL